MRGKDTTEHRKTPEGETCSCGDSNNAVAYHSHGCMVLLIVYTISAGNLPYECRALMLLG